MGGEVYLAEYGRAKTIHFDLVEVDGVDLRVDASDGGSDCIVMTDEAAEGTATNDFVDEGTGYSLVLTAAEMAGARITVYVVDSATKVWLDKTIHIETFGHLSSAHPFLSPYWTNGAVNDGSASSTVWTFDGFTEATANHVIGSLLTFTSGANAGQCRPVTDYTSTVITVSPAFIAAPADNDEFVLQAMPRFLPTDLVTWLGVEPRALSSQDVRTSVRQIGGSTVAANNLTLQYNTTGLTGGKFPANQDQVGAIGTAGGAALNFAAADDNVDGALNSITFVGTQTSGTFVSTEAEEGTNHVIDDDTNNIDIVYQFNIGGGRTATEVIWKGFLAGAGDSVNIQLYDFIGTDWETRAVIAGKNQSVNETIDFPVLAKHTGTGANIGIVYVRFVVASGSNQTLETDELIVEAVAIGQSVGYQNGQVWIDTNDGVAGTENFVNGVADNPVSSIADALTIAASVGLKEFHVAPNSTIALGASFTNKEMEGHEWTLDLDGRDIGGSEFIGATVSGVGTGTGTTEFLDCFMNATTIPAGTHLINCDLEGTITFGAAGTFFFENCTHGNSSPSILDFGSGLNASTVHMHPFHGALEIKNMGAGTGTYVLHLNGDGILIFNSNCSATSTINLAGLWAITNNASGLTINNDGPAAVIELDTDEIQQSLPHAGGGGGAFVEL